MEEELYINLKDKSNHLDENNAAYEKFHQSCEFTTQEFIIGDYAGSKDYSGTVTCNYKGWSQKACGTVIPFKGTTPYSGSNKVEHKVTHHKCLCPEVYGLCLVIKERNYQIKNLIEENTLLRSTLNKQGFNMAPFDDIKLEGIKQESLSFVKKEVGPRIIPGWLLHDVDDKGNCFYDAVAHQMQLIEHSFLKTIPKETLPRDSLRLCIQGSNFKDEEWAADKEIEEFVKQFDVILAIVDTRSPKNGYIYYYLGTCGNLLVKHPDDDKIILPKKQIIKIAATGNHFLSIVSETEGESQEMTENAEASSKNIIIKSNSLKRTAMQDHNLLNSNGAQMNLHSIGVTESSLNFSFENWAQELSTSTQKWAEDIAQKWDNSKIQTLSFDTKIGDEGCRAIAIPLKFSHSLTSLTFKDNNITSVGIKEICEALMFNSSVKSLSIIKNHIEAEGSKFISMVLAQRFSLTSLNLSYGSIGFAGATELINGLKKNSSLKCLNISSNNISNQGVRLLCSFLKNNTSVVELDLSYIYLGKNGTIAISEVLKSNTSLSSLNLYKASINDEAGHFIKDALMLNSSLTYLNLEKNSLNLDTQTLIRKNTKNNSKLDLHL